MTFKDQQYNWEGLAETDPLWAVLSEPEKRGNLWDVGEFYRSGLDEAEDVIEQLQILQLSLGPSMLDVGCGPGRVTHAFALYFDEVVGYDISDRMLDLARMDVRSDVSEEYILNETDDLSFFYDASFDFVYCNKVLQHVDPERIGAYMSEMVRVLKPGGVLFLQMLSHPTGWEGTKESAPDPNWGNGGPPPHYTVCSATIDFMLKAFIEMDLIVHQARLVDGGREQSIFSYEYICQVRS